MNRETVPSPTPGSIRITYRESAEHLLEGLAETPVESRPVNWFWILTIAAIVLLVILRSALERQKLNWAVLGMALVPMLLLAVFYLYFFSAWGRRRSWITHKGIRDAYLKETGRPEVEIVCEFGAAAFFVSGEGGVASNYPWTAVRRVIETRKGLLVYHGPEIFQWFPRRVFASDADYAATVALMRAKVANFTTSA